jgi:uncharacterized protein (TIGR03437 family)
MVDGAGAQALFSGLGAIAITSTGEVLVTDPFNKAVRRISNVGAGASVSTVAGTDVKDGGPAPAAFLDKPEGVAADFAGNVFIADTFDSRIRSVGVNGFVATAMGPALAPSGPQNAGAVRLPHGMAVDAQGAIFVADTGNQRIFRQRPGAAPEVVAGDNGAGFSGDGGPATSARLASPWGVAVDTRGNVFIADYGNFRIRKVDAATHNISTVAGNGSATFSGDGAAATAAGCDCRAVAVDNGGNLFLADTANHRIRRVDAGNGIISTIAGGSTQGYSGDGGPAAASRLFSPTGVAIDNAGNLYIADSGNSAVRMVSRDGIIRTVAGTLQTKFSAESGQALAVNIDPRGVAIAPDGSILIADSGNDRVRRLTRQKVTALALPQATQNAAPGQRVTLAVRVMDANGVSVFNVPVSFVISSGSGTLSASSAVTGPDGIASVVLNLGSATGVVIVNASVPDLEQQQFRITVALPPAEVLSPKIDAGGVVGAGLSVPPVKVLVPLGLATIFGQNFARAGTVKELTGADLVDGRVPTQLAGVCVSVGSTRAPVTVVTARQVTFQVPLLPAGPVAVRVITGCGTANETTTDPEPSRVEATAPEFFFFVNNADGRNPIAAVDAMTGAYVGKPGLIAEASFAAARIGQVISLYANYFGVTNTGLQAGVVPQGLNSVEQPVQVEVGGHVIPAANILYAGMAPSSPGQYQINLILDAATPRGDQPVTVSVGGVTSPAGAYLTVAQ